MTKIDIRETSKEDIPHIVRLWNDGDVMRHVGFPEGLGVTEETLIENWLPVVNADAKRKHYSLYHDEIGYCGEAHYRVDPGGNAALDIKLFKKARGKGIAYQGLKHAVGHAFSEGNAKMAYVDPHKDNGKALALYEKLGFDKKTHPDDHLGKDHVYMVLTKKTFESETQ